MCAKLRKAMGTKKIGHTGTLDPFATGLLIIAVGKATKLIPFLEKDHKTYETEILLGYFSETLDTESEIRAVNSEACVVSRGEVKTALKEKFSGKIQQVPPKYSALKIGGKKMCDMARKGTDFEIKPRETEIISTEILDFNFPVVKLRLTVAAGFYVRSFARDLGEALGLGGGICQQLRRIAVGPVTVDKSIKAIESAKVDDLIMPEKILTIPRVEIDPGRIDDFLQGRAFRFDNNLEEKFMVLSEGRFLGVGEMKCGNLQPRLGFQG